LEKQRGSEVDSAIYGQMAIYSQNKVVLRWNKVLEIYDPGAYRSDGKI